MEGMIVEAYHKSKIKDFFSITICLERLIRRQLSQHDPRAAITTGQVQRTLRRHGLEFSINLINA